MVTRGNYSYLFIDTAGIRRKGKTKEKLEKFSILKSLGAMNRCDVAVVLIDADEGITEQDTKVIGRITSYNVCYTKLLRQNKIGNQN